MWSPRTYQEIKKSILEMRHSELPGPDAHYLMAPVDRKRLIINEEHRLKAKRAAVLLLLVNKNDQPAIVLTKRKEYPGVHSAQISFPGGKREKADRDFRETALRETHEEIGVPPDKIELVREMSEIYIPPSNFLVSPYLGYSDLSLSFIPEETEVELIMTIDINLLFNSDNISEKLVKARNYQIKVPAFEYEGHIIWGATAMMLRELREWLLRTP